MLKLKYLILLFLVLITAGCSENLITPGGGNNGGSNGNQTLMYQRTGLIDSLNGTCSAYLLRTHFIDTLDFTPYENVKITLEASTDGDLSNIEIYYVQDSLMQILSLEGLVINNTMTITVPSPKVREFFQLRLKLNSSVCTGHLYHLRLRNLKIYGIN